MKKTVLVFVCILPLLLAACASTPPVTGLMSLEEALAGAAASVEEKAQGGGAVAVVKINSPLASLSDYLVGELDSSFTASGKLTVVARGEILSSVNKEQQLQMSGLVSDESAAGIGHFLGAQVVISGDFSRFANFSQLSIRAVDVETTRLLAAYTAKIAPNDPVLAGITAPLGPAIGRAVSEAELEQLNLAKDYIAATILDIAIEELDRLIAKNPHFAEAWFYRGKAYTDKALDEGFKQQNISEIPEVIGRGYRRAIADFSEAIRLNPNNPEYYIWRGSRYRYINDYDHAIADYTRAIRLDPNNSEYYVDRAIAYTSKGQYWDAIADLTEAIRLSPNNPQYYIERAWTYEKNKDYVRALADYNEMIRIAPDMKSKASAYSYRSNYYKRRMDTGKALADITEAIRLDPEYYNYIARAELYKEMKNYDLAIADYTQAIRLNPDNAYSYLTRGDLYFAKKDNNRAMADYETALRLYPNVNTFTQRAFSAEKSGDLDLEIMNWTLVIRLEPNNAVWYTFRGFAYEKKRDYDRAIADFTEAIRLEPGEFTYYGQRGSVYSSKGDYDRAIADYNQAIRNIPSPYYYNARGDAYYAKKDYDRAIADFTEAIRLEPHPHYYNARGDAYYAKRDYDRAIADYEAALRIDPNDTGAKTSLERARRRGR